MTVTYWAMVHGDSDGVACGALSMQALSHVNDVKVYFTHPAGLAEDLAHVKPGDSVFIADIALSESHVAELISLLERVLDNGGSVIYVDHHPLPLDLSVSDIPGTVVHDVGASASELVYRRLWPGLGRLGERVALLGAIGDYLDDTLWVRDALERWDKRHIYFEAGVLSQGLEGSRRMYDFKREVVRHLASGALPSSLEKLLHRAAYQAARDEEMRIFVEHHAKRLGHIAYVIEPPGSVGKAARYAMVSRGTLVGVAIERRNDVAIMSLRAPRSGPDLNRILRRIAKSLGGTGGGHPWAAGARIPWNRLSEFLRLLASELEGSIAD